MAVIRSPFLSLPFAKEPRNPFQLLWTVDERKKSDLIFAVTNVQGEMFLVSYRNK